jgi:hypothetical protein
MFLACVELSGRGRVARSRVVQLQFSQLDTARIWAQQESARHSEATGNAAVFQTMGPLMSLAWENDASDAGVEVAEHDEAMSFAEDTLVPGT